MKNDPLFKKKPDQQKEKHKEKTEQKSSDSMQESVMHLQKSIGNEAVKNLLNSQEIQPKLKVSQSNEPSEVEADMMADKVISQKESNADMIISRTESLIQRKGDESNRSETSTSSSMKRSTRVWSNLSTMPEPNMVTHTIENRTITVDDARLRYFSDSLNFLSLNEYLVEVVSGSDHSQGQSIILASPELLNIYRHLSDIYDLPEYFMITNSESQQQQETQEEQDDMVMDDDNHF